VLPHLCRWLPLKEYLGMASSSRACFHHALPPLKHRAFLAVVRAQMRLQVAPLPLLPLADAVVRCQGQCLPPGVSARGMSRRALLYLRANLRAQAVRAWRAAGELLLARVGDRLKTLEQGQGEGGSEWPLEAAVWSSRITTEDVRLALTVGDYWGPAPVEEGKGQAAGVMAGDPWWESVMKGLAREAGVVDFDDGALHLLLQEWDKGLRAAVSGRRTPGPLNAAVEAAPVVEKDKAPMWDPNDDDPPRQRASCLRMALLMPFGDVPWPMMAGIYSAPNPPWPEVTQIVRDAMLDDRQEWKCQDLQPSVGFMRRTTQVCGCPSPRCPAACC
jgi:hypothetical protein